MNDRERLVDVEGTVRFMRTEREDPPADQCKCCTGAHVFCRYIECEPAPYTLEGEEPKIRDWLQGALQDGRLENRRVRVTMELLPLPLTQQLEASLTQPSSNEEKLRGVVEQIADAGKAQDADPLEWATWAHELAQAALREETP